MNTHGSEEHDDPHDMWNLPRVGIYTHNDIEEKIAREKEVDIHREMSTVRLHQLAKERGHVKNEERTIEERERDDWICDNHGVLRMNDGD